MAASSPAAEQAADLMQKMSLDPKNKPLDAPEVAKKSGGIQHGSVNGGKSTPVQSLDRSATPFLQSADPNTCYMGPYYYGGHGWGEDYSKYMGTEGAETPAGVYGDVYSTFGYPYGAYPSPGSPAPAMGHDGQLYSPQHYQYTSYYQSPTTTNATHSNKVPTAKTEVSTSAAPSQPTLDASKGLHNSRPTSAMGQLAPSMINRMYPNNPIYSSYSTYNTGYNTGIGFGSSLYGSRSNGRWGPVIDNKYKPKGRGNGFYGFGNDSWDGLSELNRGPRSNNNYKNQKGFLPIVPVPVKSQGAVSNGNVDESAIPDKEQFNKADFPDNYADAKFFIIKSYSEDDIHKSIKYGVWASTPNGNKKLDGGYQESQAKSGDCPIFLFFSVNTSGQFVGVAEMVSAVNFEKTVDYWQQDKWTGCFSVKWHIVKDVPNNILKHIILENNENKPVTNSRDTQEVKLEQGLQMLKIFKEHVSKTSILDDFAFYESRQKVMQEKRAKQKQLHKQITDVKPTYPVDLKDDTLQKPLDAIPVSKEAISEVNGVASVVTADVPNGAKPAVENKAVANGVANAC